MKLINKYIFKNLVIYTLFSFIVLTLIYTTFQSISELNQLGQAQYKINSLILHNFYLIPTYIYEIYPIAILIGSILFFIRLSANNEYVIIRINGTSLKNLILILFLYASIFTIFNYFLSELIIPKTQKKAEKIKNIAIYGKYAFVGKSNVWFKLNNKIITIGEVLPDSTLKRISIKYIDNNKLLYEKYSPEAIYIENGLWELQNSQTTTFDYKNNKTLSEANLKELWQNGITYQFLDVLIHKPQNMSIHNLFKYIQHLKKQKQKTFNYEIEFWRKVLYPIVNFIMVLFALSMTPLITRYSNIGVRIFTGTFIGVIFQLSTRFFNYYSKIYNILPIIGASMPIILFLILALILLKNNKINI